MGGGGDNDDLRISTELLDYLFEPLRDVLKEQGQAVVEMSDQMKVLVTLVNSHPTRLTLHQALDLHDKQAASIAKSVSELKTVIEKALWISGLIWSVTALLMGWFHFSPSK